MESNLLNGAWYALRRTLPFWSFEKNLSELIEFCKNSCVDEVIIKVDTEEFTHAIPSLSWLEAYMPKLRQAKQTIEANGIVFSLNPWVTLVHCDRGRNLKETYPDVDLIVGHDGTKCTACCCPLSPGWRKATKDLWNLYASLEPNIIWIEDDIRLLNHQPVAYGCFCDLHMKEFCRRAGKTVSREELVSALLAPGTPHPYRKIWLDLNREAMVETVQFLESCVHTISPKSNIGMMCSLPNAHAIEGRDWDGMFAALAGKNGNTVVARPCMCNYEEWSPRGLYDSEYTFRSTRYCLPSNVKTQTEIDNVPFTLYSKSTRFTYFQCALSFIYGSDGVTMNLFDHMGSPMAMVPEIGAMLKEKKAILNAISERCKGGRHPGVQILHAKDGSYNVKVEPGANFMGLSPRGESWLKVLDEFGLTGTFEDSNTVALSGQVVRSLSDSQIKKILSGGALIDLGALKCLMDMGYQKYLGVNIKRLFNKNTEPISAEEYFNKDFGGYERCYLTLTIPGLGGNPEIAEFEPDKGAVVVSRIVDPDTKPKYPFLTLYKNSLGGRIALYPVDISICAGTAFINLFRKHQMENVINWLSCGHIPLCLSGGAHALPFRIDKDSYTVVGAFNLSLDDWAVAKYDADCVGRTPKAVEILQENGSWATSDKISWKCENGRIIIECKSLQHLSVQLITIRWN